MKKLAKISKQFSNIQNFKSLETKMRQTLKEDVEKITLGTDRRCIQPMGRNEEDSLWQVALMCDLPIEAADRTNLT